MCSIPMDRRKIQRYRGELTIERKENIRDQISASKTDQFFNHIKIKIPLIITADLH